MPMISIFVAAVDLAAVVAVVAAVAVPFIFAEADAVAVVAAALAASFAAKSRVLNASAYFAMVLSYAHTKFIQMTLDHLVSMLLNFFSSLIQRQPIN
jgi:hypothetical protein